MLYIYCKTDGFDIIKDSRLRLSRIDKINDPFELVFDIDENSAQFNIKQEFAESSNILQTWSDTLDTQNVIYDKTSPEDILQKFIQLQICEFRPIPKKLRDIWNQKIGIVCMSEARDVIQMWAHYADNHKGIVVGIEESEFVRDREAIITVCYRDKMVLFPVTGNLDKLNQYTTKYVTEVLGRKETHWSYEKEVRLYVNLEEKDTDGHYYINIPCHAIKEIYLGLRSDDTLKMRASSLKEKPEYRHLKIFKMLSHKSAFKLTPQEINND
ncbi:MAG: DUF2971 domain-containing protein [Chitinivibrionales bacterium]